jgi:beta-catenin-like protein 1
LVLSIDRDQIDLPSTFSNSKSKEATDMNVEELLNYQPTASVEDNERDERDVFANGLKRKFADLEELERRNKQDGHDYAETLDENALKRLLTQFERKLYKNQELRIKFVEQPTKFLDSEMELFDALQEMHVLSTQPELYQTLVDGKVVTHLLGLLSHENTDIAIAVTGLLHELTDLDSADELDETSVLLQALIDGQVIAQLVSSMTRFDESVKEESDAVYNSLGLHSFAFLFLYLIFELMVFL